ncbi:hypothetical protein IWX49DRAFT_324555 [Phyllosticta citricarpa]
MTTRSTSSFVSHGFSPVRAAVLCLEQANVRIHRVFGHFFNLSLSINQSINGITAPSGKGTAGAAGAGTILHNLHRVRETREGPTYGAMRRVQETTEGIAGEFASFWQMTDRMNEYENDRQINMQTLASLREQNDALRDENAVLREEGHETQVLLNRVTATLELANERIAQETRGCVVQ